MRSVISVVHNWTNHLFQKVCVIPLVSLILISYITCSSGKESTAAPQSTSSTAPSFIKPALLADCMEFPLCLFISGLSVGLVISLLIVTVVAYHYKLQLDRSKQQEHSPMQNQRETQQLQPGSQSLKPLESAKPKTARKSLKEHIYEDPYEFMNPHPPRDPYSISPNFTSAQETENQGNSSGNSQHPEVKLKDNKGVVKKTQPQSTKIKEEDSYSTLQHLKPVGAESPYALLPHLSLKWIPEIQDSEAETPQLNSSE